VVASSFFRLKLPQLCKKLITCKNYGKSMTEQIEDVIKLSSEGYLALTFFVYESDWGIAEPLVMLELFTGFAACKRVC